MVTIQFFLLIGLGLLCSLQGVATEPAFIAASKVTESYAVNPRMESGLGTTLPKEYHDLSCRYVDLGGFERDENLTVLNKNLSPLDSVALGYLNKVKATGSTGEILKMGRISSFITEKRRGEVLQELDRLQKLLKYHDQVNFFRTKEEGNLGVSLFIMQNQEEPFTVKSSLVALLKEGEEWVPCVMPSSFTNTNISYDGELRDKTTALEVWAQGELGKHVETVEKKKRADAENKLLALRKGLKEADARVLLDKLAQGLADRDPVQIASVLHLRGGIAEVDKEMRRRQQDSMGLLNALSDPRSIVVPLDPAPCVLSKEEEKLLEEPLGDERFRGEISKMKAKNGETGDNYAFGVILPRFKGYSYDGKDVEPRYLYYLPLYFSSADVAARESIPEGHHLGSAERDGSPFLGFAASIFSYDAMLASWAVKNIKDMKDTTTVVKRMARDFPRRYPAFQFQTAQEAAKFILSSLVGDRYMDLVRCLPNQNFSGTLLMKYVSELDVLSDQVGVLAVSEKHRRMERQIRNRNALELTALSAQREDVLPPPIENVVLYEGKEDAVLCWKQVDADLDRARFASLNLRKEGGFWYLYLPSDPMLAPEGGLSKIAKQLEIYYASQQLHASYQKVAVLKKVEKLASILKSRLTNDFIMTLIKEKNMSELLKYCLVLEDTPESRKRMEEALVEHVLDYGYQSVESRIGRTEAGRREAFLTTDIHLLESTAAKEKTRLLEAPWLFLAQQGDRVYWVPELTLLSGLTPKSKEVSEQRLALAAKFLPANILPLLRISYSYHQKNLQATIEMKKYVVEAEEDGE